MLQNRRLSLAIGGVLLTALNGNPYYSAHYIAARRMG